MRRTIDGSRLPIMDATSTDETICEIIIRKRASGVHFAWFLSSSCNRPCLPYTRGFQKTDIAPKEAKIRAVFGRMSSRYHLTVPRSTNNLHAIAAEGTDAFRQLAVLANGVSAKGNSGGATATLFDTLHPSRFLSHAD